MSTTTTRLLDNYVGGAWTPASAGEALDVIAPASGEVLARVPLSGRADLDAAVAAARAALPAWRGVSVIQRARHLFALREGQVVVAQTSILGSIFANALLVLGITLVIGARRGEGNLMRFGHRLPKDTTTLLLVATFVIVLVGISIAADDNAADNVNEISVIGAVVLLAVYAAWVIPFAREGEKHGHLEAGAPSASLPFTLGLLAAAGIAAAFVSEWFVGALGPAIDTLGVSEAFAGLVIVAIAGNAVENVTGSEEHTSELQSR